MIQPGWNWWPHASMFAEAVGRYFVHSCCWVPLMLRSCSQKRQMADRCVTQKLSVTKLDSRNDCSDTREYAKSSNWNDETWRGHCGVKHMPAAALAICALRCPWGWLHPSRIREGHNGLTRFTREASEFEAARIPYPCLFRCTHRSSA